MQRFPIYETLGMLSSVLSLQGRWEPAAGGEGAAPTWISSMVCTMKVSCRSSMAPSIQLLKGAARLAYSKYSWSMVSSSFSVR